MNKRLLAILAILFVGFPFDFYAQEVWSKTSIQDNFEISSLVSINGDLYAGLIGGGVFMSSDEGLTWQEKNVGLGRKPVSAILSDKGKIYASVFTEGLYMSNDKGDTWNLLKNSPSMFIFALVSSGPNLIIGSWEGVFYTNDFNSWQKATISGVRKHNIILSLYISKKGLFAGSGGYIFKSMDNGKNWTSYPANTKFDIISFTENDKDVFAGTTGEGIIQLNADGLTWNKKNPTKTESELTVASAILVDSNTLISCSPQKGFLADGTQKNAGYQNINIRAIAKHKGHYYAGTYTSGVWKLKASNKVIELEKRDKFEFSTSLSPNPARYGAALSFYLSHSTDVKIDICNSVGGVIRSINFISLSSGNHEVKLNDLNLLSGIYYIRAQALSEIQINKLIVVL